MKLEGSRILVIGGAGFIGSQVTAELLKTDVSEVVVYDNFTRGHSKNIADLLHDPRCTVWPYGGDIRDIDLLSDAMSGMDAVFHLAAMWLLHCRDYPRAAFHVNIEGTFNVLEACVKNKIKRLVYSSSASVYGDALEVPMTESHPFNNRNFYGATKIAGEALCRAFYDRYGLNYIGLRYMNVYGPHQDQTDAYTGVIPAMLNKIDDGENLEVNGNGKQSYDFIYVEDVARANLLALQADSSDEFYNVGSGGKTSIRELCEMILRITASDLNVHYKAYGCDDSRQQVWNRTGCTKKARADLGFEAQVNLPVGLRRLIDWRGTG